MKQSSATSWIIIFFFYFPFHVMDWNSLFSCKSDLAADEFVQFIQSELVPLRCTKLQKNLSWCGRLPLEILRIEIRYRCEVIKLFQTINEFTGHFLIQLYVRGTQDFLGGALIKQRIM